MDLNAIKKDLYKSKNMAKFSHYTSGNLYYTVDLTFGRFQFPIATVEEGATFNNEESGLSMYDVETIKLSEDLGQTTFAAQVKGSDLIRWISKAVDKGEFVEIQHGGLNLTKLNNDVDEILDSMNEDDIRAWLKEKNEINEMWDEIKDSGIDKPFTLED